MTKRHITRSARGGAIAIALMVVLAAPAAAAKPTRTIFYPTGGTHPAGEGCAFNITYVDTPGSRITETDFADGRIATDVHAIATLTNETNGHTFVHKAFFHDVYTYDPSTGDYNDVTNGQVIAWLLPGDVSPFGGIVGPNGLAVRFEGTVWSTWNEIANATTYIAYKGTATNVCDLLS